jgi:hypothetical protein
MSLSWQYSELGWSFIPLRHPSIMGVRNSSISNHLWFIYYRERDREGEIVYGCEIDEFFYQRLDILE